MVSDILVVCTGNVCRSPYLAALLSARHPQLAVASAGMGALLGAGMPEPAQQLLRDRGIAPLPHAATALTPEAVRGARLLLCATAAHRTGTITIDPGAADRSFTVLELARLVTPLPPGGGLLGLLAAGQAALTGAALSDRNDDLNDPWQQPAEAYERMGRELDAVLAVIDPWLGQPSA